MAIVPEARQQPERERLTDVQLLTLIRTVHVQIKGAYGSPRMTEEAFPRFSGQQSKGGAGLMSDNGSEPAASAAIAVTTDSRHKLPIAPNVLNRNFIPAEPNQVFTSDITYVWTDEGWL